MCAGDMALENFDKELRFGRRVWTGEGTGEGTTHVCKNWGEITRWQEMHLARTSE
jgi:hypothetical protein